MKNQTKYLQQEPEYPRHMSFLLRLWQPAGSEATNWQASLEVPGTGKRLGFANLERLFAYLMEIAEDDAANALGRGNQDNGKQKGEIL